MSLENRISDDCFARNFYILFDSGEASRLIRVEREASRFINAVCEKIACVATAVQYLFTVENMETLARCRPSAKHAGLSS